jgi:hypothetical protein
VLHRAQVRRQLDQQWWLAPGKGMEHNSGGFAGKRRHTQSRGGGLGEENPDRWASAETTVPNR